MVCIIGNMCLFQGNRLMSISPIHSLPLSMANIHNMICRCGQSIWHNPVGFHLANHVQDGIWTKLVTRTYWLYSNAIAQHIIGKYLTRSWTLGRFVRRGSLLSALLYAIATHSFLWHLDHLADMGRLHGLQIPGCKPFLARAYADDSFFMLQSIRHELQMLMYKSFRSNAAGQEAFHRYSALISGDALPFVRASSSSRVVDSATNWTAGKKDRFQTYCSFTFL